MPRAAAPPINNALILISLPFLVSTPAGSGPAPDPETVDRLPIVNVLRLRNAHRPENAGGRLARNAATPSVRSWVNAVSAPARPSIGASRSSPSAELIIALII